MRRYVDAQHGIAWEDARADSDDGFYVDFGLLTLGYAEWKKTGRIPHPDALALPAKWVSSLFTLDKLVADYERTTYPSDAP